MTVFSTPFAFMRSSSISAVASFSGGLVVSLAQGKRGSFFHTCTCGSMMRYFCAPSAAPAVNAPRAVLLLSMWLITRVYSHSGRGLGVRSRDDGLDQISRIALQAALRSDCALLPRSRQ